MTRAEVLDLYYRTLDWKEIYYEAQAKMDAKKTPACKHRVLTKIHLRRLYHENSNRHNRAYSSN